MALPQKESSPIFSDATAGTLRLIAYLALAAILMVLDHRNGWLHRARYFTAAAIVPIYKMAAAPADWVHDASTAFAQRSALIDENRQLRNRGIAALMSGWPDDDRQAFVRLLTRFTDSFESHKARTGPSRS